MAIKTFTTGEVLTASDTNTYLANSGLVYVSSTTFSASTGVEMQNCFSSTYDNYLLNITYYGSASTNTSWQFMSGTNTKDTSATYTRFGYYWTTFINNFNAVSQNFQFFTNHGTTAADYSDGQITVYRPNVSGVRTNATVKSWAADSGLGVYLDTTQPNTTQYTGFYLFPSSGNITGTITVYGFRKP